MIFKGSFEDYLKFQSKSTQEKKQVTDVSVFDSEFAEAQSILESYGISKEDISVPDVVVTATTNFEDLCLYDQDTKLTVKGVDISINGHTGPLLLLEIPNDYVPGDKFQGYAGYYPIAVLKRILDDGKPAMRKLIVNYSTREDDDDLVRDLKGMKPGSVFTVAEFPTNAGFRVYRLIPAQPAQA